MGVFSKLKNKINYKINEAVEDPNAEEYARTQISEGEKKQTESIIEKARKDPNYIKVEKEAGEIANRAVDWLQKSKLPEEEKKERAKPIIELAMGIQNKLAKGEINEKTLISETQALSASIKDMIEEWEADNDDTISPMRIVKKTWKFIKQYTTAGAFPMLSILLAMLVANDLIMYPAMIRLCFFIFVIVVCTLFNHILLLLSFYYLCKWGYDYFVNDMDKKGTSKGLPTQIMPRIYAILPITTYIPASTLGKLFLYPFSYPKSEEDASELERTMEEYKQELDASFPYYERLKEGSDSALFIKGVQTIMDKWKTMHQPTYPEVEENEEAEEKTNEAPPLPKTIQEERNARRAEALAKEREERIQDRMSRMKLERKNAESEVNKEMKEEENTREKKILDRIQKEQGEETWNNMKKAAVRIKVEQEVNREKEEEKKKEEEKEKQKEKRKEEVFQRLLQEREAILQRPVSLEEQREFREEALDIIEEDQWMKEKKDQPPEQEEEKEKLDAIQQKRNMRKKLWEAIRKNTTMKKSSLSVEEMKAVKKRVEEEIENPPPKEAPPLPAVISPKAPESTPKAPESTPKAPESEPSTLPAVIPPKAPESTPKAPESTPKAPPTEIPS